MEAFQQWLASYSFFLQLALVAIAWAGCHSSSHWLTQAVAKTLLPWLLGMAIVLAVFLAAKAWLPRSQDAWLVSLETGASDLEVQLKKPIPYPFIQGIGLLFLLMILNVRYPTWKPWSKRLEKTLSMGATAVAVLTVFTSFTFFATGQDSIIKQATAQEKYQRVEEQAEAVANRIIGARIAEDIEAEAKRANDFLTSVKNQVEIDHPLLLPLFREGRDASTAEKEKLRDVIEREAAKLLEAMNAAPLRIAHKIDQSRLADIIRHRLTKDQITEANEKSKKVMDEFVGELAKIRGHPLTGLLESAGLPELPKAIVRGLIDAEVSRLAKKATEPLADSLFRPDSIRADIALADLSGIANRSALVPEVLPAELRSPATSELGVVARAEAKIITTIEKLKELHIRPRVVGKAVKTAARR